MSTTSRVGQATVAPTTAQAVTASTSLLAAAATPLANEAQVGAGLAVLRGVVGAVFIAHGAQKLFVFGLSGVAGYFGSIGIPLAGVAGPAVAFAEFLGGFALLLGLYTRVAGAALAAVMLGAIVFVHLAGGFFAPEGVEFVLTLFGAALALAFAGGGRYSLDAMISRRNG